MVSIIQILLISLSLAMDALSVSIAGGMQSKSAKVAHALKLAVFFGSFQAFMPVIGWFIGEATKGFVFAVDHWIAFILLGIIGIKMIWDALGEKGEDRKNIHHTQTLLLLSIATSIDALIVGITLNLLEIPFLASVGTIGLVTFMLSFFGFLFGKQLGGVFGKKVEILGGAILVLIGFKILIEHIKV